ncbi:MAG: tetratricopeptide repeat protein [Alphaproteobacteria bacterium]|nr:tetratricopeptide repeat protein [Alphaproteobacteria bacterium]
MKILYALVLVLSLAFFNSCGEKFLFRKNFESEYVLSAAPTKIEDTVYGTYLAGRVAHMRQDYNLAANYYIKSIELGTENNALLGSVYLLLASEGRIDEAAIYANQALSKGDKSNLIRFILMSEAMGKNKYDDAYAQTLAIEDKPFKESLLPLFQGWIFAAQNDEQKALESITSLKKDKNFLPIYYMHRGMLYDYFGKPDKALEAFETLVGDEKMPLSVHGLEIIGNFYIRTGKKDEIVALVKKYYKQNAQAPVLKTLYQQFERQNAQALPKLIDTPQKGLAEAVFSVGTMFRGYQNDVAQLFSSLVLYLNSDLDAARLSSADLLGSSQRLSKAIEEYEKIGDVSPLYYVAQLKIAESYMLQEEQEKAFTTLQNLLKKHPEDEHIMFRLGELSRVMGRYQNAVSYYRKALEENGYDAKASWIVYYALGIAFERQGDWEKAENALKKALDLSARHPIVLNYLGYSWLERGTNYNEALFMIFEAHRAHPEDGHITDSLGWALYKMGNYDEAVKLLERASAFLPSNAVVFDHLGDAYWQVGRKAEAKFQWKHALSAKDDKDDINTNEILQKIENGLEKATPIPFNEQLLIERLRTIDPTI